MKRELCGKSVKTNYGNFRQYQIVDVLFNANPYQLFFTKTDKAETDPTSKQNVGEYFREVYQYNLSQNEHIIIAGTTRKQLFIPAKVCSLEGIPDYVKKDFRALKEAKEKCISKPEDRCRESNSIAEMFSNGKAFRDWGIQVDDKPT